MRDTFKSVAVAASIIILGLFIVSAQFGAMPASEYHEIENESITADVGNWTQVEESHGEHYHDNATVTNPDGATMQEGDDYEWETSNASVYWYDSPEYNDGDEMRITYSFDTRPEPARESIGLVSNAFTLGAMAVVLLTATLVLAAIAGFDRRGGRGRM